MASKLVADELALPALTGVVVAQNLDIYREVGKNAAHDEQFEFRCANAARRFNRRQTVVAGEILPD